MCSIQKVVRLMIASADGYVYIYAINPAEGGDCTLLKQHRYVINLEETQRLFKTKITSYVLFQSGWTN